MNKKERNYKRLFQVFFSVTCIFLVLSTVLFFNNLSLRKDNQWRNYYGWYIKYETRSALAVYPISYRALLSFQLIELGGLDRLVAFEFGKDSKEVIFVNEAMDKLEQEWFNLPNLSDSHKAAMEYFRNGRLPDFGTYTPKQYANSMDAYIAHFSLCSDNEMDILWLISEVIVNKGVLDRQQGIEEGLTQAQ